MKQAERAANRRKFPRFTPQTDLFVIHSHFGKILNIGMGGVLFTYAETEGSRNSLPSHGVLFTKEDDYLVELPFRTVSDTIDHRTHHGKYNIRKRVVVFEDLSPPQVDQLEQFILDNVSDPAVWQECIEVQS